MKAVFLFGPTAVGKTELMQRLNPDTFEIVSADSLQVYRRLDIGTAKPSQEVLLRIRHHLIDIADPHEHFDVGDFVRLADEAVGDIAQRGKTPIVCGGAAFYLRQLLYGLPPAPASSPEIRAEVRESLERDGLPALYDELLKVDSETAERIGPSDEYRITRALEVWRSTGRPLSDFPPPSEPRSDMNALLVGLDRDRAELHDRIGCRVEAMFAAGLRDEVAGLVNDGYELADPGLRGIGYREFFDQAGAFRPSDEDPVIGEEIRRNTRRYCKRQITFFRSLSSVAWFRPQNRNGSFPDDVVALLDSFHSA